MSDYNKYKESHLKAQKKYNDKYKEKRHQYDKLRWQKQKENNRLVVEYKEELDKLKQLYEIMVKDLEIAETRNKKAINEIEDFIRLNYSTIDLQYLLDILRGETNE